MPWNESRKRLTEGVNHVVGTGCKPCVRYVPRILGGPGRNRPGPWMPDSRFLNNDLLTLNCRLLIGGLKRLCIKSIVLPIIWLNE